MYTFAKQLKHLLTYPNPFDDTLVMNGYKLESNPIIHLENNVLRVNWSYECILPNQSQKVVQIDYIIESDNYVVKLRKDCSYKSHLGYLNELNDLIHNYVRS